MTVMRPMGQSSNPTQGLCSNMLLDTIHDRACASSANLSNLFGPVRDPFQQQSCLMAGPPTMKDCDSARVVRTFVSCFRAKTRSTQYPIWPIYIAVMYIAMSEGSGAIDEGYSSDIWPNVHSEK